MGFGKDGKGTILYDFASITVGALASGGVSAGTSYAADEDFRILKAEIFAFAQGVTAGDGPLLFGLADGGLTSTEISEAMNAQPVDSNDYPAIEHAGRPVWPIAMLVPDDRTGTRTYLNPDGLPVIWDKRWTFGDTPSWKWFVFNMDPDALQTGGIVYYQVKLFGVWVR